MAKIATDLEQSKKLAKILPIESADMYYCYDYDTYTGVWYFDDEPTVIGVTTIDIDDVPAWSLSALMDILRKFARNIDKDGSVSVSSYKGIEWTLSLNNVTDINSVENYDMIDACVDVIIKLKEKIYYDKNK